jgi:hypothetical protein
MTAMFTGKIGEANSACDTARLSPVPSQQRSDRHGFTQFTGRPLTSRQQQGTGGYLSSVAQRVVQASLSVLLRQGTPEGAPDKGQVPPRATTLRARAVPKLPSSSLPSQDADRTATGEMAQGRAQAQFRSDPGTVRRHVLRAAWALCRVQRPGRERTMGTLGGGSLPRDQQGARPIVPAMQYRTGLFREIRSGVFALSSQTRLNRTECAA